MKCKIYFIQCLETGEVYIGSTKQELSARIKGHRNWKVCSCKEIIDRGNYIYDILEEVEESQRYIREQYYMDTTDNCINKYKARTGLSRKESEKQRYIKNRHKILEHQKQYKLLNQDKIKQTYTCECGKTLLVYGKPRHLKSKKHQDYLKPIRCKAN